MPKQKDKASGKTADSAPATPSESVAPGKLRRKDKADLAVGRPALVKAGVPKRSGKRKAKVPRKGERARHPPEDGAARAAEAARKTAGLQLPLIHKITRRRAPLGSLERLEIAIDEVRRGGRASPRTRKLQTSGLPKMAQKVIEEAGELAIEAVQGNRDALVAESVDLLYNLLVLLGEAGVSLDALWAEMDRRELALGMAEKLPKAADPEG